MITPVIIFCTCLISLLAFYNQEIFSRLIFNPYTIKRHPKEWFRFVSSGFIHADYIHLGVNMLVLWSFGKGLEYYYKFLFNDQASLVFLVLYLTALVASSLSSYFKHRDHSGYNALGASGAVSAVVFAVIFLAPMSKLYLFGGIPIRGVVYGILYLFYSSYMARRGGDNIGHEAHFFGAVYGFFFTGICKPWLFQEFIEKIKELF